MKDQPVDLSNICCEAGTLFSKSVPQTT